jgi:hypothetical protein
MLIRLHIQHIQHLFADSRILCRPINKDKATSDINITHLLYFNGLALVKPYFAHVSIIFIFILFFPC